MTTICSNLKNSIAQVKFSNGTFLQMERSLSSNISEMISSIREVRLCIKEQSVLVIFFFFQIEHPATNLFVDEDWLVAVM